MDDLVRLSATEIVRLLKAGEISNADTLDALENRIACVDSDINALPTLCFERAREAAKGVDTNSILAGIPIAIKDLEDVAGVRTTYGSMVSEHHIPQQSNVTVTHIEANGGMANKRLARLQFRQRLFTPIQHLGSARFLYLYNPSHHGLLILSK